MPGYVVINPTNNKVIRWMSASGRGGMPLAFDRAVEAAARFAHAHNIEAIAVVASIATIKAGHHVSDLFFFGGPYVMVTANKTVHGHEGMPLRAPGLRTEQNPSRRIDLERAFPGSATFADFRAKKIDTHGLHIEYLPANQAYALMWYGTLLRIFNSKREAHKELGYLLTHPGSTEKYQGKIENPYEDTKIPGVQKWVNEKSDKKPQKMKSTYHFDKKEPVEFTVRDYKHCQACGARFYYDPEFAPYTGCCNELSIEAGCDPRFCYHD